MVDGETEAALIAAVAEALTEAGIDLGGQAIGPATTLDGDVGLDSFQTLQVARILEKRYAFAFSFADWVLTQEAADLPDWSVGCLVGFMHAHLTAAPGGR